MYNAEQKQSFLNTIVNDNSYKSYVRVFNSIEDMEERFEKDICDMSIDEILIVLDFKTGTRVANTEQFMSLIRLYVDWCIQNGKTTSENNFEKIDAKDIDKTRIYKSRYIKNPEEFENMIKIVFNEGYDYNATVDRPKELCVRLCYEGMEDEEIVLLKKTDVDYENGVIHSPIYPDVVYKVSERILYLCKYCSELEEVEYANRSASGWRAEKLCDNVYVLRQRIGSLRGNSTDKPINKVFVSRKVKEFNDAYVETVDIYKNITASKLRESRLFYQIHLSANPDQFIEDTVSNESSIKTPDCNSRNLYERIRQVKNSYRIWENTFY